MKKSEREPELIRLWEERPLDERTMNDVFIFTGWLYRIDRNCFPPPVMAIRTSK